MKSTDLEKNVDAGEVFRIKDTQAVGVSRHPLQPFLKHYESKHPTIKVNKEQTVSTFVMEKSYLLLMVDIEAETEAEAEANAQKDPEIVQVVYQGKQNTSAEFMYDVKQNEFVRKEEKVMFGFRTVSKPRTFYNVLMSDIDVDCFFYDYTSEPEW